MFLENLFSSANYKSSPHLQSNQLRNVFQFANLCIMERLVPNPEIRVFLALELRAELVCPDLVPALLVIAVAFRKPALDVANQLAAQ